MKNLLFAFSFLAMTAFISSCEDDNTPHIYPETISIEETALHAEGVVFNDKDGKIYMGSYYLGKIVSVDLAGNIKTFAEAASLVSPTGMVIDEANNWLIVCNADAGLGKKTTGETVTKLAEILFFDMTTGNHVKTIDLNPNNEPGRFTNDIVLDNAGNIYVTDSFRPTVYKIDTDGNVSVFATDDRFAPFPMAFGLNGIVYHPDGYLLVGKADEGKVFKIMLNDPTQITEVNLDVNVNSIDGLLLDKNEDLYLVSNNFTGAPFNEAVYKISTSNAWSSASITNTFTVVNGIYPTTLADVEGTIYVNYANFPALVNGSDPIDVFTLEKINF